MQGKDPSEGNVDAIKGKWASPSVSLSIPTASDFHFLQVLAFLWNFPILLYPPCPAAVLCSGLFALSLISPLVYEEAVPLLTAKLFILPL